MENYTYDKVQTLGRVFDVSVYKAMKEGVATNEAIETAYKVVDNIEKGEPLSNAQIEAIFKEWESLPQAVKFSKGRTTVTEGLEDGGVYLAIDSKGDTVVVKFEEYDDYSGCGGQFFLIGSEVPVDDGTSPLRRSDDYHIAQVVKERIL